MIISKISFPFFSLSVSPIRFLQDIDIGDKVFCTSIQCLGPVLVFYIYLYAENFDSEYFFSTLGRFGEPQFQVRCTRNNYDGH